MTTFATLNPLGSTAVKDLYDNAENLDNLVNGNLLQYLDRFGIPRKSYAGIEQDARTSLEQTGYVYTTPLNYAAGITISLPNQIFNKDGEYYKPAPGLALPYVTTGNWATEQTNFRSVGDATLRSALATPNGVNLVGGAFKVVSSYAALTALTPAAGTVTNTSGYYAAGDGGAGSYIYQPGTGWTLIHSGTVSAKQFGAKGDGATADTTAIQTALNLSGVSTVLLGKSAASYRVGAINVPTGKTLRGDGSSSTVLEAIGTSGTVVTLRDSAVLEGVYFTGNSARTSGAFVFCTGRGQKIRNVDFNNYYIGITLNGVIITLDTLTFINACSANGSGIRGEDGGDWFINNVILDNGAIMPRAGFHMVKGGGVWLTNCDFIHAQNGVLLEASGTDTITNFFVENVACDTCSDSGWHFVTYASGAIRNLRLSNCWGATNGTGLLVQATGGDIDGIFLTNFTAVNNSYNGVSLNGDVRNFSEIGGVVSGNSQAAAATYDGIYVGPNISNVTIIGVKVGPGMTFADIQKRQINVADGTGYNHHITGNLLDTVQTAMYFGPTDARNRVGDNAGAIDRFINIVTTDANGFAVINHGGGFIPNQVAVSVQNNATPLIIQSDQYTRANFRVRIWSAGGTPLASSPITVMWKAIL
jgi:hypothetical protein